MFFRGGALLECPLCTPIVYHDNFIDTFGYIWDSFRASYIAMGLRLSVYLYSLHCRNMLVKCACELLLFVAIYVCSGVDEVCLTYFLKKPVFTRWLKKVHLFARQLVIAQVIIGLYSTTYHKLYARLIATCLSTSRAALHKDREDYYYVLNCLAIGEICTEQASYRYTHSLSLNQFH